MGIFQSPGTTLTSEERFVMASNVCSASTSRATTTELRATTAHTPGQGGNGHLRMHGTGGTRSRCARTRGNANKASMSHQGHGFSSGPVVPLKSSANRWVPTSTTRKAQPDVDSAELVDRNVKALLNKLTMEKFETISDQIIHWANKSVNEKDGRTLIQVIRLVFEKAIDEATWSEMYARLCRKMMEEISPEVQDEGVKDMEGKPIRGGHLFRKYLLTRCQENFERGWFTKDATTACVTAKPLDNQATDAGFDFNQYYEGQKAKRQGLNLITFIGELFKVRMLTGRIMHECVKKLLRNIESPEEEEIESLCQLLKTVGQLLDTPKARAHMDVYFTRMKELSKSYSVSTRMQFMLQDVIELRDRAWMSRSASPLTIAAVHVLERAAVEECFNHQTSLSRGGSPASWAVAGGYVPQAPLEAGGLSPFDNGSPMTLLMGPSGIFGTGEKESKQEALFQTNLSSNMLSQNPESAAEASTKLSPSSSRKPSIDLGHHGVRVPEPTVQDSKLQLLLPSVCTADESMMAPLEDERESASVTMSEADIKMEIDKRVKAFFAVHNLEEVDVYFTNLPHELGFRLVDNHKIRMSRGSPRGGSEHNQGHGLDSKQETPSQLNSSSTVSHMNPKLNPNMSTKPSGSLRREPDVDLNRAGASEPAVQRRKIRLLPRSVPATEKTATTPSEEPKSTPTARSKATAKVDGDVKKFFAVRNLQ
ncbi:ARM repeat-containing protein [Suillus decipiens]|nr:ARM repeat-containing protein [Suillus decipiens]